MTREKLSRYFKDLSRNPSSDYVYEHGMKTAEAYAREVAIEELEKLPKMREVNHVNSFVNKDTYLVDGEYIKEAITRLRKEGE